MTNGNFWFVILVWISITIMLFHWTLTKRLSINNDHNHVEKKRKNKHNLDECEVKLFILLRRCLLWLYANTKKRRQQQQRNGQCFSKFKSEIKLRSYNLDNILGQYTLRSLPSPEDLGSNLVLGHCTQLYLLLLTL